MTPRARAEAMLKAWCDVESIEDKPRDRYRNEFVDAVAEAIASAVEDARGEALDEVYDIVEHEVENRDCAHRVLDYIRALKTREPGETP